MVCRLHTYILHTPGRSSPITPSTPYICFPRPRVPEPSHDPNLDPKLGRYEFGKKLLLLHRCNQRSCVLPRHQRLGAEAWAHGTPRRSATPRDTPRGVARCHKGSKMLPDRKQAFALGEIVPGHLATRCDISFAGTTCHEVSRGVARRVMTRHDVLRHLVTPCIYIASGAVGCHDICHEAGCRFASSHVMRPRGAPWRPHSVIFTSSYKQHTLENVD